MEIAKLMERISSYLGHSLTMVMMTVMTVQMNPFTTAPELKLQQ